jgi:hypothetical protein
MGRVADLDIADYPTNLEEPADWAEKLTIRDASGRITQYGSILW